MASPSSAPSFEQMSTTHPPHPSAATFRNLPQTAMSLCNLRALVLAVCASPVSALAQGLPIAGAPARAVSVADDSLIQRLARDAAQAPNDANAWYAYGKAASNATRSEWRKGLMSSSAVRLVVAAESSLARAVRLAPDSIRFAVDLAAHLFGMSPTNISRAENVLEQSLAAAQRSTDRTNVAAIADHLGVMTWRRYETVSDRRPVTQEPKISNLLTHASEFWNWYGLYTSPYKPPLGVDTKRAAAAYFRTARLADSSNALAVRHELMVPIEDSNWDGLLSVAREQIALHPGQPWSWLAAGLAQHRLGRATLAAESFDRGLALLETRERAMLMDVGRVLSIRESARHAEMPDSTRDRFDALFWSVGDPSLLIPGNVFRSEHLARVVHADLRWSNEEEGVRGANSDRGDALIRFGLPDIRASFKFSMDTAPNVVWAWTPIKLHLFFRQMPLYGTALMSQTYRSEIFEPVTFTNPSFFGTLPGVIRGRDTLLVQAARFRGIGDSVDLAVFAGLRNVEKKPTRFDGAVSTRIGVFSLSATGAVMSREITTIPAPAREAAQEDNILLRARIAPGGTGLRVDALREHDMSVARWMTDLTSTMKRGFSISDLIVTERATPRSATATGTRWTDFDIQPNPAITFSRKRPIDLLWEIYELSPSVNGNQYRLSITLQREDGKGAGAVFARVIGMAAGAVGVASRDRNSISLTYDRAVPASLTIAETVRLDLSSAPTGRYQVSISVLDKSSGRTERTVRTISIVD